MESPELQSWRVARDAWQDHPGDPTRERLQDTERALRARVGRTRDAAEQALKTLDADLAALIEVEEQAAADAEMSARHGELAGAAHGAQERIAELEAAREEVAAALETLPGPDVVV